VTSVHQAQAKHRTLNQVHISPIYVENVFLDTATYNETTQIANEELHPRLRVLIKVIYSPLSE